MTPQLTPEEMASLEPCTQCGMNVADVEEEYAPELRVLEENFGSPYLFGIVCRVCGRVATGAGQAKAVTRWNKGEHDGDVDDLTGKLEEV